MAIITRMTTPILLELVHNDVVVRQVTEDEDTYDVHNVHQIRTVNATNDSYHLQLVVGGNLVYQDQVGGGQEKIVDLSDNEVFEDWAVNVSISTTG